GQIVFVAQGLGAVQRFLHLFAFAAPLRASDVPDDLGFVGRALHQIVNAQRAAQVKQRLVPILLFNRKQTERIQNVGFAFAFVQRLREGQRGTVRHLGLGQEMRGAFAFAQFFVRRQLVMLNQRACCGLRGVLE